MWPRYFGPMIVIFCNKGGTYIICDLDGTLVHTPIVAFRVVPYLAHTSIDIPDLEQHINVSVEWLCKLENGISADPDNLEGEQFEEINELDKNNSNKEET